MIRCDLRVDLRVFRRSPTVQDTLAEVQTSLCAVELRRCIHGIKQSDRVHNAVHLLKYPAQLSGGAATSLCFGDPK